MNVKQRFITVEKNGKWELYFMENDVWNKDRPHKETYQTEAIARNAGQTIVMQSSYDASAKIITNWEARWEELADNIRQLPIEELYELIGLKKKIPAGHLKQLDRRSKLSKLKREKTEMTQAQTIKTK